MCYVVLQQTTVVCSIVEAEAVHSDQPARAKKEAIFSVDSSRRAGIRGVPMRLGGRAGSPFLALECICITLVPGKLRVKEAQP